jgi:pimeloyl-ACP methyl ester carboxylesterase
VEADQRWCELLVRGNIVEFEAQWSAQPLFAGQRGLRAEILDEQRRARLGHDPAGLAHALRVLGLGVMPPLWPRLEQMRVPVDWVVGSADSKFMALAERAQRRLPACRLHVISGAGHNVLLERPDAIAQVLRTPPPDAILRRHQMEIEQ